MTPVRRWLLAVALVSGLMATGCAAEAGNGPGDSAASPGRGGRLTVLVANDSPGLSPFLGSYAGAADGGKLAAIYDMLAWADARTGSVQMQLAESLTPDSDNRAWTLRLHSGVSFTDGTPFDAAAVKYNWELHADPATHSQQAAAARGLVLTVMDALTLHIALPTPNANFDQLVAHSLAFVASPTAMRKDPQGFADNPVGAGPFIVKEWVRNGHLTVTRNPGYWQQGLPHLDEVDFKVAPETADAAAAIAEGSGDLTIASDFAAIAQARNRGVGTAELHLSGGYMIAFNTTKPPFDDARARRAVVLALNQEEINSVAFAGVGKPAHGIFSADSPVANSQLVAPSGMPAEAARLFSELAAEGKPVSFTYLSIPVPSIARFGDYLAEKLAQFQGVSVTVQSLETPQQGTRIVQGDYQAGFWANWTGQPDPGLYNFLHSGSSANITGYHNTTVDRNLELSRGTRGIDRRDYFINVQVQLNRDMPFWVYQEPAVAALFTKQVKGLTLSDEGVVLFDKLGRSG